MSNLPRVLVAGCGPAGLTAALSLAQNGVPLRIIEKDLKPRVGQRGAAISPRTLELFEALEILEEVQQKSVRMHPVRSYRQPGNMEDYKEFTIVAKEDPTPTDPFRNFIALGQDGLDRIMRRKLGEHGYQVDYGIELLSLERLDNEVKVVLRDNKDGSTIVEETYEYVIGADGARGAVRKQLGLQFLGDNLQIGMAIGDVMIEGLSCEHWHMWGKLEESMFVGLRGTEIPELFNFILGGTQFKEGKELCQDHEHLCAFLSKHTFGIREDIKITEVVFASPYTPTVRMVDVFSKGNVFVIGDAAHVHSPAGGQGMNTGVQDGYNLAWKLAMVCKGWSPESLLNTYNEERSPVVAQMLNITNKLMADLKKSSSDEAGWNRSGSGLNQLGVNYRWSSIVVNEGMPDIKRKQDDHAASSTYESSEYLRAGDRAPDASGLREISGNTTAAARLFKLFAPTRHTLLILSSSLRDAQSVVEGIGRYRSEAIKVILVLPAEVEPKIESKLCDVYTDTNGYLYEAYSKAGDKARFIVVRPDGVVGAIVENVEWVNKYFDRILLS